MLGAAVVLASPPTFARPPAPGAGELHAEASPVKTLAVARFPDAGPVPDSPETRALLPDQAGDLELLSRNPYDDELSRALANRNLFGDERVSEVPDEDDDLLAESPYAGELRLRNPYSSGSENQYR